MKLLSQIFLVYSWTIICLLLFFLLGIAQFFEQRLSEKHAERPPVRFYPLFIIPIIFFAASALMYLFGPALVVGLFWADALRIIGTIVFVYAGYLLVSTMVGGKT